MEAGPGEGQGCPGYFPSQWTGRRSLASRCAELRTWLAAERRAARLSAAPPGERRKRAHSLSRERSLLPFNSFPNTEVPPREASLSAPGPGWPCACAPPLPQGRLPQPSGSTLHSLRADPKTHRGCDTALPVKSRAAAPVFTASLELGLTRLGALLLRPWQPLCCHGTNARTKSGVRTVEQEAGKRLVTLLSCLKLPVFSLVSPRIRNVLVPQPQVV